MIAATSLTRVFDGVVHQGRLLDVGTRAEILDRYPRALVEVHTSDRLEVRARLTGVPAIDDVSPFGATLHVRGRDKAPSLLGDVRRALHGIVDAGAVIPIQPSLGDVFVLQGKPFEEAR